MSNKRQKQVCPICIEIITPSKYVECGFCNYTCCSDCVKQYLLSIVDDANCMNCKRIFDRETLLKILPKTFIQNGYKKHRENVLLERETAMLSATQPYVDQEIQRRKNLEVLDNLNKQRLQLRQQIQEIDRTCRMIQMQVVPPLDVTKKAFVHRCPRDTCNGFLSSAWKCNVCAHYICSECNVPKGLDRNADHVCNENDKKTFEMIKADSRKCPGCATYIHRISGCDQMWCTQCHTAFSWRTGEKVNGNVHNPHFYEFQRNRGNAGRELADVPCGGRPHVHEVRQIFNSIRNSQEYMDFQNYHRLVNHIDLVERPRYPTTIGQMNNMDLRVKYMMGEVSDEMFKHILQKREKSNQKKREIGLIFEMFTNIADDLMRQTLISKEIKQNLNMLIELTKYCNRSFACISLRYDCVVPAIDNFRVLSKRFSTVPRE